MQVALLTYNAMAGDAIGNQVAEKLAFLLERGADACVFVESDKRLHPVIRPHCRRLRGPETTGESWQFLNSADLIIVEYGQYYSLLGLLPLLAGGKPRILFDYHGVTPADLWTIHNREAIDKGAWQRSLVWCADAALVHSRFTRKELHAHTSFPAERTHILSHAVDLQFFTPGSPACHVRDELSRETASLVLFVGRLAPNKRVPLLIEALARLRDLTPPVHVVIAGDTGDLYQVEAERCRQRAEELGVIDRLHFLGHVSDEQLRDAYRSADVFVMPSRHEGFCIPVIEAMACGVPVIAARAGALTETIGNAGLAFIPDDADDLARQIRRVLRTKHVGCVESSRRTAKRNAKLTAGASRRLDTPYFLLRLAVVAVRYGTDFVGGAETSLRTIATALHDAGHVVEVFTTCTKSESDWTNQLSEGTTSIDDIPVHRFRLDEHDRERHHAAVRAILEADGLVAEETEREYLRHSIHAPRLLEALRQRLDDFDAVVVGPYLFGLTHDVAQAFPERTILLPCFHDEPFARLRIWAAYRGVGGILYHSPEERDVAEIELGLNHPRGVCLGTFLDTDCQGDAEAGRRKVGIDAPYLVYCGRYSRQKNLPALLDYARRYHESQPERFRFVFLGQGEVSIPGEDWARDLGFIDDISKRDILAGAAAVVQLSRYESLSLVALEAWAQGVPVLASQSCTVLASQLSRCGAGRAVDSFEAFAAALDDLWQRPQQWQIMGQQGRQYVQSQYGCRAVFTHRLVEAIHSLKVPLADRMRRQGLMRAAAHDQRQWRERFGRLVEELLDAPKRPYREQVKVWPRNQTRTVSAGQGTALIPVRVTNQGTHTVVHDGPGHWVLRCRVVDEAGQPCGGPACETPLPGIIMPGQEISAAMRIAIPAGAGAYRVGVYAERGSANKDWRKDAPGEPSSNFSIPEESWLQLIVEDRRMIEADACCTSLLESVQTALAEAERRQCLPDDYLDVTEGFLAKWKRRIKRKLLGNFKQAYVDVLSRQQSAFNRHILATLQELAECCALLDHARTTEDRSDCSTIPETTAFLAAAIERAVAQGKADELAVLLRSLMAQLAASQQRHARLDERLTRLELRAFKEDGRQTEPRPSGSADWSAP